MIQPILVAPFFNERKARSLVEFCWRLDRTSVRLIIIGEEEQNAFVPVYPENAYHSRQASGLRKGADEMAGRPFIWLEADSVPLRAGWAQALSDEYERQGKPFLISSDSHPPHDLVGGIGVYPPNTSEIVPVHFPKHSWDWLFLNDLKDQTARTPMIEHSYGVYGSDGFVRLIHKFPRDQEILRSDALLFHRDPTQSLISS